MTRALAILTEEKLGPAMTALTEQQRRFVFALAEDGSANHSRAAATAGYSPDDYGGQRVAGHRLWHDPKIRAAIQEVALARINSAAILAGSVLQEIAENRTLSAGDRLKAAGMILNRSGLHEKTEHKVVVEDTRDPAAMVAEVKAFAARLGLDPKKLLGEAGIIDAEFEVVSPTKQDWEQ